MLEIEKHPHLCPVCGKYEFQTYDWYEICPVCGWEDNAMQNEDPDCAAGPNKLSLKECRRAYLAERCGGGREIENQVKFIPT